MADRLLSWFQQRKIGYLNNELLKAAKIGYTALLVKVLQRLFRAEGISVLPSGEQHVQAHSTDSPIPVSCDDNCSLPVRIKKLLVTPLLVAVQNGHIDCVRLLLKYGADIEGRGDIEVAAGGYPNPDLYEGYTPLLVAAASGNIGILRCLLENGADINAVTAINVKGYTPLMISAHYEQFGAVTFLIDQGADVNLQDEYGYTALHHVAKSRSIYNINALNLLIDRGADLDARTKFLKETALMLACGCNNVNAVKCLLQNGVNVDLQDKNGKTCLDFALRSTGHPYETLSFLLKSGVDVSNARRNNDQTLLMQALCCHEKNFREIQLLIDHGANVDFQDQNGDTALHYVVRHCSGHCFRHRYTRDCAQKFLSALWNAGASHLSNNQGLTPLLLASCLCKVAVVECILKQAKITKEQRIDALELLGASCVLYNRYDRKGFWYIERGMTERFRDPLHPLLKQQMKPIEAYQNRKESQTLTELHHIELNWRATIMEGLIIRERILGVNNALLVPWISSAASSFRHNFSAFFALKMHAIKIAHHCNQTALEDLQDIIKVIKELLDKWSDGAKDDDFVERFDEVILAYAHEVQIAMKKKNPRPVMFLWELILMISKFNCGENGKLPSASLFLKTLCNVNPGDGDGNTLLHQFVRYNINCNYHRNNSCSHIGEVKFLINSGFNVNAINNRGDTPLHLAVYFYSWRNDALKQLEIDMLQLLIDKGAHHDFVNNDGKTPMDMANNNEARMILTEQRRKLELQCIAARAVKKLGIPYMGVVPKTLEKYISMH